MANTTKDMEPFDREKYKVFDAKSLEVIHWKLNPGLAFNELVLGQRIPKVVLVDKTSDRPMLERGIVLCPHCERHGMIHGHGPAKTISKLVRILLPELSSGHSMCEKLVRRLIPGDLLAISVLGHCLPEKAVAG